MNNSNCSWDWKLFFVCLYSNRIKKWRFNDGEFDFKWQNVFEIVKRRWEKAKRATLSWVIQTVHANGSFSFVSLHLHIRRGLDYSSYSLTCKWINELLEFFFNHNFIRICCILSEADTVDCLKWLSQIPITRKVSTLERRRNVKTVTGLLDEK